MRKIKNNSIWISNRGVEHRCNQGDYQTMKAILVVNIYDNVELPKRMFIDELKLSSYDGKMLPIHLENVELRPLPEKIDTKKEMSLENKLVSNGYNICLMEILGGK